MGARARCGSECEAGAWAAAVATALGLKTLAAGGVGDEWRKGVGGGGEAGRLVELWRDVGALARWLPEVGSGEWGVGSRESIGTRESGVVADLPKQDAVLITSYLSSAPAATLARLTCSRAEMDRRRRVGYVRGQEPDKA